MRNNRHTEFVKSIRLIEEKKKNGKVQGTKSTQVNKMTKQEEIDLQKKRFDELFGITEED